MQRTTGMHVLPSYQSRQKKIKSRIRQQGEIPYREAAVTQRTPRYRETAVTYEAAVTQGDSSATEGTVLRGGNNHTGGSSDTGGTGETGGTAIREGRDTAESVTQR